MSDGLIRKIDVLDLLNDFYSDFEEYSHLFDDIDFMNPVNAVELPCKIGDTLYCILSERTILSGTVESFTIYKERICINVRFEQPPHNLYGIYANQLNKYLFLHKEEAEKALEKIKLKM